MAHSPSPIEAVGHPEALAVEREGRVVFVGPLPPPIHGMAQVNQNIVQKLGELVTISIYNTSPGSLTRGLAYHATKGARIFVACCGLFLQRLRGARVLYASVDDGLGGLWSMAVLLVARILNYRIFLHHHNFRYIMKQTSVMAALTAAAGADARHILLCTKMKDEFAQLYPHASHFLVVPNAISEESAPRERMWEPKTTFTIGLLSNLTFEKGLAEFIELIERLLDRDIDIRAILAGPAANPEAERFIAIKCAALGTRLQWLGRVLGEEKEAFFAAIDLFVFPTRLEAFGLVLSEALIRGVPFVAPAHGCICLFERLKAVEIVPAAEDFVAAAGLMAERLARDVDLLAELSAAAREEGITLNRTHGRAQQQLARNIAAEAKLAASRT